VYLDTIVELPVAALFVICFCIASNFYLSLFSLSSYCYCRFLQEHLLAVQSLISWESLYEE
jgi:hypothetical protein